MAFNSSGVYSRVSNSFSEPVVGTTISPTDADTYFDDIDAALNAYRGTSTTSLAIGTGAKVFTTQAGKLFVQGRFVIAFSDADEANYMYGQVTTYSGTSLTVDVLAVGGSGTLADWTIYTSGPRGATGPTGATGSTGATGATVGVQFAYSTTTTDADPGSGVFRFNNATIASVTAGYFDNNEAGGAAVNAWLDTFDDSTNTAKGTLVVRGVTTATAWAVFNVTGSVVDGTGYRKLTLTHVASGGTFTNAETFAFAFSPAGNKGTDGAGTGDFVGPASSTDNAVVRFDSTTGKLGQNSAVIIDDSNNVSGVATLTTTGAIELGNASDTTVSRSAAGVIAVEGVPLYSNIPQNSQSAAYTLVLADAQKHILHGTDSQTRLMTIPANSSVAFPIGTVVTFVDRSGFGMTIGITTDTLQLVASATTGTRTLAAYGIATAIKVTSTLWMISGTGLT